jgi:hypothetical protein
MTDHCSPESRDYKALHWCVSVGTVLATLIVLFASFSAVNHWLMRLGSIAVVLFSTANLILVYHTKSQRPQSPNAEFRDTTSDPGNSGGAR